jgi:hypothetical protein
MGFVDGLVLDEFHEDIVMRLESSVEDDESGKCIIIRWTWTRSLRGDR